MKRAAILVSALAVFLSMATSAQAQFAGKWVMDAPAAPPAGGGGAPGGGGGGGGRGGGGGGGAISGMEVTIVQDATTLTVNKTGIICVGKFTRIFFHVDTSNTYVFAI